MRARPHETLTVRVAIALLLVLSLVVAAVAAGLPTLSIHVVAKDDGEDDGEDDDNSGPGGGDIDEDDAGDNNSGKGNKKDKDKEDDEKDLVTAVPTATSAQQPELTAKPTVAVLTPERAPTDVPSSPVTTGTLVITLRVCPDGTDPAIGTAELAQTCTGARADARFELGGRSGPYRGWRRDVTTDDGGDVRVASLAAGAYSLTLDELDWCAAEASAVDDGLIVVTPGETTEVTAYLCGGDAHGTPTGR